MPVMKSLFVVFGLMLAISHSAAANESLPDSGPGSFFSGAHDSLAVEVAKDQKTATMKLATWSLTGTTRTSVEVQAPFDKDGQSADYATLDGLRSATAIALGIDFRRINMLQDDAGDAERNRALCKQYTLVTRNENCDANMVLEEAKRVASETPAYALLAVCQTYGIDQDACDKSAFPDSLAAKYADARQQVYASSTSAWLVPIKLKYGLDTYKYQDPVTLVAEQDKEYPVSASVGVGYLNHRGFFGLGYEYQESFKAQKSVSLCTPVIGQPGVTQCTDTVLGAPAETTRNNAFLEARVRLPGGRSAVGIKLTKDVKQGEEAAELPFYLLQTEKKGINAGIRLGWSSLENDVTASVFFGTGFSFYK